MILIPPIGWTPVDVATKHADGYQHQVLIRHAETHEVLHRVSPPDLLGILSEG